MVSRYNDTTILKNRSTRYKKQFLQRGVKWINQYATAKFNYPAVKDMDGVTVNVETYAVGDRFYKYAHKYYGDPSYWWIIAIFNQKPIENMVQPGDTVYIPTPLVRMLQIIEE